MNTSSSFIPFSRARNLLSGALVCVAFAVAMDNGKAGEVSKNAKNTTLSESEIWNGRDRWFFSAGWMWRETEGGQFRGNSRSQQLSLPSLFGRGTVHLPEIGDIGQYGNRFYTNGFVLMDGGTATDGTTSAWGYHDASQVQDGSLQFHASGHHRTASGGQSFQNADGISFEGGGGAPVIEIGWEREMSSQLALGARFQWSFLDFDGMQMQSNFAAWQQGRDIAISYTDTYALQGVIPPEAPYEGAGLGFGPLIDNIPTSRQGGERILGDGKAYFFNRLQQSFEVKMHTFSLGPVVSGRFGPLSLQGGAGLALNVVNWEAEQRETLYLNQRGGKSSVYRRWVDQANDTEVLPGFYLQGGLSWSVTERFFVNGFARYDWSEAVDAQVGPASFSFDPTGWSTGIMIGINF